MGNGMKTENGIKTERNPLKRPSESIHVESSDLMDESRVGITEFLNSNNTGFEGAIKQRYSDFNVYEVGLDGVVVHVTDQTLPVEFQEVHTYSDLSETERLLISDVQFSKLKLMDSDRKAQETVEFDVTEFDKDKRREVHMIIKKFSMIDSNTLDRDGKKLVVAKRKKNQHGWPRDRPRYLHFSLYKENMDTYEACSLLSNKVRTQTKFFSFAGTKDKRGRTVQRVSVSMVEAKSILGAARCIRNLEVGDFSYVDKEIKLGDLKGNRFELVIRNVSEGSDVTEPILKYFVENGFINYFGMQRFGTMSVGTHEIGRALLKSDWQTATELILKPRVGEGIEVLRRARKVWWGTRNARKALDILRNGRKDWMLEAKLLEGMVKMHHKDQVGALNAIPRTSRQMYVHSYQSYVWNRVVSRRIKEHGTAVMVGDLVKAEDRDVGAEDAEGGEDLKVKVIEDVEGVNIWDVLVPLPGYKVKYPDNCQLGWYKEILEEDGLTLDSFSNTVKDYNLPGDYRHMVIKAWDVSWYNTTYNDVNENITKSDKDRLEERKREEEKEREKNRCSKAVESKGGEKQDSEAVNVEIKEEGKEKNSSTEVMESKGEGGEENNVHPVVKTEEEEKVDGMNEGKFAALVVSFSLSPGSYATMALREIMKVATDKTSMTKMNEAGHAVTAAGGDKHEDNGVPIKKQKLEQEC